MKVGADYFPPFIIVTDEAHNFAPKGYDSPSKSIQGDIPEVGNIVFDICQPEPTLLDETITAQLNTKLTRTVRASDIQTIQKRGLDCGGM